MITVPLLATIDLSGSPRISAIDIPMTTHRHDPAAVVAWDEAEEADRALSALVIAVEQLDDEPAPCLNSISCGRELRARRVAERSLPEAEIPCSHVDISRQAVKRLEIGMVEVAELPVRRERPA